MPKRLVQHCGQLLGRECLATAALPLLAVAVLGHLLELVEQVLGQFAGVVADGVLPTPEREVHLEHRLEGAPVGVVLHQRRRQGVLEGGPVLDRDVLDRLHGVEVLGEADRQARFAQLEDEAVQQLQHLAARDDDVAHAQLIAHRAFTSPRIMRAGCSCACSSSRW